MTIVLSTFFKSFVTGKHIGEERSIHSVEQFCSLLEYERARCARNGHVLSLIVFTVGRSNAGVARNGHLAHTLIRRIRSIDEAGWLDNQHVGILLPYTSTAGAWKLTDDICQIIGDKAASPQCAVYTHPFNWFSDDNGQLTQLHFRDIFPEWRTTASPDFSVSDISADRENIDLAAQHSYPHERTKNFDAQAEGLRPFLSCPLPIWKRSMDIIGASLALIVLSPIMALVAIIIKIVSPGPVFFKQQRVGYMGKNFTMLKFRTMKVDTDATAHQLYLAELINGAAHNDESLTKPMAKIDDKLEMIPFGKILRQTCVDELPQLINVLRGEMSLVGPRPPIPYEVKEYLHWHKERIDVVPGMTGLWQVSGKNRLTFKEMTCLDIQYWRKKSLWLDIKILLMTPGVIFSQIKNSLYGKKSKKRGGIKNA
jgi:lipopolysaccharide/colanic/teichoic acid biosynthesis glycosyltransferase